MTGRGKGGRGLGKGGCCKAERSAKHTDTRRVDNSCYDWILANEARYYLSLTKVFKAYGIEKLYSTKFTDAFEQEIDDRMQYDEFHITRRVLTVEEFIHEETQDDTRVDDVKVRASFTAAQQKARVTYAFFKAFRERIDGTEWLAEENDEDVEYDEYEPVYTPCPASPAYSPTEP